MKPPLRYPSFRHFNRRNPFVRFARFRSGPVTPRKVLVLTLVSSAFFGQRAALAHHVGAQVSSAASNLMSSAAGSSNQARQRGLVLGEVTRASDEPALSPSTSYKVSLGADVLVHPEFSLGARFPWVFVEQDDDSTQGYGDTVLELVYTPGTPRLDANVFSFGLVASLPTRSYQLTPDPGTLYSATAYFAFTHREEHLFWQALLLSGAESRPAGIAWEAGVGMAVGYRFDMGLGLAVGGRTDTRLSSYCRSADGEYDYCETGRATEHRRGTGVTRGYAVGDLFYTTGAVTLSVGAQRPVTPRRDFDLQLHLGAELEF